MPVKLCWMRKALMEQPLPQLQLQRLRPLAGPQERQIKVPLPLRLLVHLDLKGLRPVPRAPMEVHLVQLKLELALVEELIGV
jgi:hypothetical protein